MVGPAFFLEEVFYFRHMVLHQYLPLLLGSPSLKVHTTPLLPVNNADEDDGRPSAHLFQ